MLHLMNCLYMLMVLFIMENWYLTPWTSHVMTGNSGGFEKGPGHQRRSFSSTIPHGCTLSGPLPASPNICQPFPSGPPVLHKPVLPPRCLYLQHACCLLPGNGTAACGFLAPEGFWLLGESWHCWKAFCTLQSTVGPGSGKKSHLWSHLSN